MKLLIITLFTLLALPSDINSSHLYNQNEIIISWESTKESISFAKYHKENGVVKYSAYWCSNCLKQGELFGKQAYKQLNGVECAKDVIYSQT